MLSLLAVFYVFRWTLDTLRAPLGYGDLLPAYAMSGMWSNGTPFGDNSLGFPHGMHLPYFPTGDLTQNLMTAGFSLLTENPFLPLNLVFVASFPLTAVAALWTLRIAGLRGPLAVVLAVGLTTIPYHWLRVEHVYLATMYSAVLGVALALLVGSGRFSEALRTRDYPALIGTAAAAFVVGSSGIYYACFAILLVAFACLYRAFRGDGWAVVLRGALPAVTIMLVLAAVLLPATLWTRANPALSAVAERAPVESVEYSGALAFTMLPAPFTDFPGLGPLVRFVEEAYAQAYVIDTSGVLWNANSGSVLTTLLIVFTVVGALVVRRRSHARATPTPERRTVSLGLVTTLMTGALLFFVPWGLNYLFALSISSQLRGWDRLVPVVLTLVVVAGAVVWRDMFPSVTRSGWIVALVCAAIVLLDSVTPYRAVFDAWSSAGITERDSGLSYAADLNEDLPGTCGVLQLPYVAYPEVPPVADLSAYGHLLPALTNPAKYWSFGAMKETPDSVWLEQLGADIDASELPELSEAGFCAVHVDWRGYSDEDAAAFAASIQQLLGPPVAVGHGGDWSAFPLPSPNGP
ncbi:hypothetical protein [Oerskovia paurometabola]|uniref:Glycosyltransferase RgtA/B/C/D-like domain-containing protein n=1 Tax=Oerskovia paurometabola TaxID=162170 RepID=A0ABW1X690_9CELL|nr:hypothetical protein [Oerskovia paurometabola]MBM7496416.1 phosphoglycerol transferase [Oerskovia paurometabola]